ncbi:hypothetical protein [Amycolatopsis plumensis]|uniref:hypothetical protein n=1 Tax=Amycolatopsis plumensis TaxID=236508 RepID=UPI0036094B99
MMMIRMACWTPLSFRTGSAVDAGRNLRDGMTAQRAAALGPAPGWTSGLVAA